MCQRDVGWDVQLFGSMPTCAITDHHDVCVGGNSAAEVLEKNVHRCRVRFGHQPAMRLSCSRTHSSIHVDPFVLRLPQCPRALSAASPHARQRTLLAETRFVFEPDFDLFAGLCAFPSAHAISEVFLKSDCASGSVFGWRGLGTNDEKPSRWSSA